MSENLRERALAAYHEHQTREALARRQQEESQAATLRRELLGQADERLGLELVFVQTVGGQPRITSDGVTLGLVQWCGNWELALVGTCPGCGEETLSEPFWKLAGLGRQLEAFTPHTGHEHAGPPATVSRTATIEEQLVAAATDIRDALRALARSDREARP